jgi:putative acetyltransferase
MLQTRPERPADVDAIRELVRLAFTGHPYSRGTEPLIIDALRDDDALELSLVAEVDGTVVAHIAFSSAAIGDSSSGWFVVGPVAVHPNHQGKGIGRRLIEAGLDIMRSREARGCVLVGDPDLYARFGFRRCPQVTWPGVPDEYVLCLPFGDEEPVGDIAYHPAFDTTARLALTPLTLEDAPRLFAYRSDPRVRRFQLFEPRSLDDACLFITGCEESGWCQLGIRVDGGSVLAGDVGFRLSGDPPQAEIGVTLAPQYQGRGLATEAVDALLDHLFTELGIHRVFASVDPGNTASIALFVRLGFSQEAHFLQSIWFKGAWADDVVFALLKHERGARARLR